MSGGRKHALGQCADLLIRNFQHAVFRNCSSAAGCGDTGNGNIYTGSHSQIVILRRDHRMVKYVGGLCGRDDHQRRTDGTLIAIGWAVCNSNGFRAFCLGGQSSRTAAVQIHRGNTACIQHDLRNFNCRTACGERLLTAVQNHKDHTTVVRNTNACTGHSGVMVIAVFGDGNLAVLHKNDGRANSFLNIALVGIPLFSAADDGRTILEDAKEVLIGDAVVFYTLHNESTGGGPVGHIVKVAVDAGHHAVVGNIAVGFRIAVVFLSSLHLLSDTSHAPGRSVVEAVIRIDIDIAPGNVRRCNIIDDLLAILSDGHIGLLRHTGSQR